MAATKKTTTKKTVKADTKAVAAEAEVKTEVAADTAVEAVAKKSAAKKTTTTATKKTTAATKKTTTPAAKKTVVAEPTVEFFVEYNGVQETYASIVENVKKTYFESHGDAEVTSVRIYLKPTENAAYCVVNDEVEFKMDVYF